MTLLPAQLSALRSARELVRRGDDTPIWTRLWLPGQLAFLSDPSPRKLLRAGHQNQGKSEAGAAEAVFRLLGRHPFRPDIRPAPVRLWCVYGAEDQGRICQERVWQLLPKSEVADGCYFDERKGAFVGKYPTVRMKNGSTLKFKSGGGDRVNLTSDTVDGIWRDEPPEHPGEWEDLLKRVETLSGDIWLTLTPINRPVAWLREIVESGQITDHHYTLTVENLTPVGMTRPKRLPDGTLCDQAWIDRVLALSSHHERGVRCHGEWEVRAVDGYFRDVWDPDMVTDALPKGLLAVVLGLDHGSLPGKQIALLVIVDDTDTAAEYPRVYVLDEYVDETGRATPRDDARGVLEMLKRHGMTWKSLNDACGDRVHLPGSGRQKSNLDLAGAVARELGITLRALRPRIRTAKQGEGRGARSVEVRARWLYRVMSTGRFGVHPRCARLIEALPRYTMADDETKDPIDALVYALDRWTFARRR